MRASATSIADNTRALVAGISNYDSLSFLPSPVKDAQRLASTIADPLAASIPSKRISLLAGERTETNALVQALETLISEATEEDLIFFYFAGHGERRGQEFYLCTSESNPERLEETALSGARLDLIFQRFRGRGLFVVFDCCRGAAFAELAPAVFRVLGSAEFKVLLSATRENQLSWEAKDGSGTLFTQILTRVLRGDEVPGTKAGLIYLSELFEHIRKRTAEEFELSKQLPQQDPIYAGVVSRDPLLFVHSRLTLEQVGVQTLRYSRAFIVRMARRIAIIAGIVLFLVLGGLYTYLDHSRFLLPSSAGIAIYRGDPRFKLLGYPFLEWELSIPTEATRTESRLRRGVPVTFWRDASIEHVLRPELRQEFFILLLTWEGKETEAHQDLTEFLASHDANQSEYLGAMSGLLRHLGNEKDLPIFQRLATSSRSDVRKPALSSLAQFAPALAIQQVGHQFNSDSRDDHLAVLSNLPAPCPTSTAAYISQTIANHALSPLHVAAISAAIRSGCNLDLPTLVEASHTALSLQDTSTAAYAVATRREIELENGLLDSFRSTADWAHIANGLLTIAAMPKAKCDLRLKLYLSHTIDWVRWADAVALLHHCDKNEVATSAPHDPRIVAELASEKLVSGHDALGLLQQIHEVDVWSMVAQAIPVDTSQTAEPILKRVIQNHETDPEIRKQAVIALHRLRLPSDYAKTLYRDEWTSVQAESYKWRADDNPTEVATDLLNRFNDPTAREFVPRILRTLPLTDQQLTTIRLKINGSETERTNAIALIIMRGRLLDAVALLQNADRSIREKATQYIGIRDDLADVVQHLNRDTLTFPDATLISLKSQQDFRQGLLSSLHSLPCGQTSFYLEQVYETEDLPGGHLWLEDNSNKLKDQCQQY